MLNMKRVLCALLLIGFSARADRYDDIHAAAKAKWPDDYSMQKYEVDKQTKAANEWDNPTPFSVVDTLRKNAEGKWPDDYCMRVYELIKQLAAYKVWHDSDWISDVPHDTVTSIRERAEKKWGDDYYMRDYELTKQVAAWKELNEKMSLLP